MEEYLYIGNVSDKSDNIIFTNSRYTIKASSERAARNQLIFDLSRRLKMPERDICLHGYFYDENERENNG